MVILRDAYSDSVQMTRPLVVLLSLLLLVGCSGQPRPPQDTSDERAAALAHLAEALAAREVTPIAFDGLAGEQAQQEYARIADQLDDPVRPEVTAGAVRDENDATVGTLQWTWQVPGVAQAWSYISSVTLSDTPDGWRPVWSPEVVHPELTAGQHFSVHRTPAQRGTVTGQNSDPLTSEQKVTRVGIEKGVAKDAWEKSARSLAKLLKINSDNYVAKVKGAGELQFVEAITFRNDDPDKPYVTDLAKIRGAKLVGDTAVLALSRTFARPVLGSVGEATAEVIDKSDGAVVQGDRVGLGGLQARYDEQLRGKVGLQISLVDDDGATPTPDADPSASPAPTEAPGTVVFDAQPVPGEDLATRLDVAQQFHAEDALAKINSAAAVVLIRPSDSSVLALANGPKNEGELAANGRFAPGSTFKVVTALALLRAGMAPDDEVECPATLVVDGRRFKNYPGYPSAKNGTITLTDALAYSCNTAFIGLRDKVSLADLRAAAGSLGMGTDYDVGHPAYFGEVPDDDSETGQAAAMIGQGKVQASPMAMAAVAASVEAGHTVVPTLVTDHAAKPSTDPLTEKEADQLRAMMRRTVTHGSATALQKFGSVGAKTGTAEYGTDNPPRTHAWMIVQGDDLAMAVFVADGDSGSTTAGPIVSAVLADR